MDFGGAGDPEGEASGVLAGQLVGGAQRAVAGEADPPARVVGEVDADRADVAEVEHRPLVVAAGAQQPGAAEGERREGRLEQDPRLLLPLVDVEALHHPVPAPHLLLVAGADPAGGVDVEVAADLVAAEPGAEQQLRRPEGAAGDDHRSPGAHRVGAATDARWRAAVQATPTARPSSTRTRSRFDAGAQPRPGGDGARQVADVHRRAWRRSGSRRGRSCTGRSCRRCARSARRWRRSPPPPPSPAGRCGPSAPGRAG